MAESTTRFVRQSTSANGEVPRRRGLVPISGLMIVIGILFMGAAVTVPATRAIQEANMRDRIAAITGEDPTSQSTTSASELPAYIQTTDPEPGEDEPAAASPGADDEPASHESTPSIGANSAVGESSSPTSTSKPVDMAPPAHLAIPAIDVMTEIDEVSSQIVQIDGQQVRQWDVASYAAGHHDTSADPGEGGNVVITGHNDWQGEVFRNLEYIEAGDDVFISSDDGDFHYVVEEVHMRREVGVPLEERLATGRFMAPMPEERVTLITCWPYGINDHRIIVVAKPAAMR